MNKQLKIFLGVATSLIGLAAAVLILISSIPVPKNAFVPGRYDKGTFLTLADIFVLLVSYALLED